MADPIQALSPDLQAQMANLLALSTNRIQSSEPIHQAAMAMATRMAPAYARGAMTGPSPLPGGNGSLVPSVPQSNTGRNDLMVASIFAAILKEIAKRKAAEAAATAASGSPVYGPKQPGGVVGGSGGGGGLADIGNSTPGQSLYGSLAGSEAAPLFPQLGGGGGSPGSDQTYSGTHQKFAV